MSYNEKVQLKKVSTDLEYKYAKNQKKHVRYFRKSTLQEEKSETFRAKFQPASENRTRVRHRVLQVQSRVGFRLLTAPPSG